MILMRLLLFAIVLVLPIAAWAEQKSCGAETCGTPKKTQKTIEGVAHNCDSTTCSKSCCTLGDPPKCSIVSTTTHSCTPARVKPGGVFKKFQAQPPAAKQN